MIRKSHTTAEKEPDFRSAPAKPPVRKLVEDWGMRAVGRGGVCMQGLFGSRAGSRLGILTYHRVAANTAGFARPLHNVTPRRFRQQISGLAKRGFQFWPLQQVLERRAAGAAVPPRTVVVTFDDGFESVYTQAWPVLREFEVPATVFLNTAYLDSSHAFPFDDWGTAYEGRVTPETYRPLTRAMCREMADDGLVEFGAHTHTHADFRGRPEAFRQDLQQSVDLVREWFGTAQMTFAFPFGSPHLGFAGGALEAAAKQTDVICGLTTKPDLVELGSDPFRWGRFNAFAWDTAATLAAKLDGWYAWAPALRQWIAQKTSDAKTENHLLVNPS